MLDPILEDLLARFHSLSESDVAALEHETNPRSAGSLDRNLFYALRVSHCVPRLKRLTTLGSRWSVAQHGAADTGLDAARSKPGWERVHAFLVELYLERFSALANELVRETEQHARASASADERARLASDAIAELRAGTAAFEVALPGLDARVTSWIGALEELTPSKRAPGSANPVSERSALAAKAPESAAPTVELEHTAVVCFAMEQAGIPIVSTVRIANTTNAPLLGLTFELSIEPGLVELASFAVPAIAPGAKGQLGPLDVRLPPGRLITIVEAERARLRWRLRDGDRVLREGEADLDVLAYNEWPGARAPFGLLAMFVTPNHPVVTRILQRVRDRLLAETGDGAISGYQSRSGKRVLEQVSALYSTVQELGLSYVGLPASFEKTGQKVRLPELLLDAQMGNCLDVTLLCAACFEQMGLAPLIVLMKEHAFPGVWLFDERFPEVVVGDAARLRTQIELHQILVFDSSTTVAAGTPSLENAVAAARAHLADDARFGWTLDVRAARTDRFRPLPIRRTDTLAAAEPREPSKSTGLARTILDEAALVPDAPPEIVAPAPPPETVVARFKAWKERLLDLTLHNRLLNFRPGAGQSIPLDIVDVAQFEDVFAQGQRFQVLPRPPKDAQDSRAPELARARGVGAEREAELRADLQARRIHAGFTEAELFARARELARQARTDREEGGANTLFASLGTLKWFESPSSDVARYAPLILVPARIEYETRTQRVILSKTDDDAVGNVTLAEKLERDFGVDVRVLADLSVDESGLDIAATLRAVRAGIQRMPRWEVLEDVNLGHFTFAKFLMWKDLEDNSDVLLGNPVVRHIAEGGKQDFPDPVGDVRPEELDRELAPADLPTVVDADSSQLAAVVAATRGRTFALQGPPGTGKSQTITNLIAAALHQGKCVLFVSEKMAALDVVHRRLEHVGLGDFCLELHSNKSNKKQVVESLHRSYVRTRSTAPADWNERSKRIVSLRERLNAYAHALHDVRPLGMSFHQASARVLELAREPKLEIALADGAQLARERFTAWKQFADEHAIPARKVEPVVSHAWRDCALAEWSGAAQESIAGTLERALTRLTTVESNARELAGVAALAVPDTVDALAASAELVLVAATGPVARSGWDEREWSPIAALGAEYAALHAEQERDRARLAQRWSERLFELDLAALSATYARHAPKNALFAWFGLRGAKAVLRAAATATYPERIVVRDDLALALVVQRRAAELATRGAKLEAALRGLWTIARGVGELTPLLERGTRAASAARAAKLARVDVRDAFVVNAEQGTWPPNASEIATRARDAAVALTATLDELARATRSVWTNAAANKPLTLSAIRERLERWRSALPALRGWCAFQKSCDTLAAAGLDALVEAHREGRFPARDLRVALEHGALARWVTLVRDAEPALREFGGEEHDHAIERFRAEDRELATAARLVVASQLDARRPLALAEPMTGSEASLLLGQAALQRRHMAIRRLLEKLPNLLPRLKPCLLMSPLSVAQYLPATGKRFDLVVFDEASQIGTHDAIGAIGRGNQVIVVGDSKQLPPTTFFQRALDDDDELPDENDVTELESVLDEAERVRLPMQRLAWHYRSRHDSLIDFSNRHYYDGRLHVYASARWRSDDLGVHWRPVPDGVYHPGELRNNPIEADRLVAELVAALRAHAPGTRSFGVVTFSAPQQAAVEDRIERARVQFPEIEGHFAAQLLEPVFVKNLENVQGDERDEIFLSVGYAPDERGRLIMQFGPINRTGGERRLNVAITRARCALRVFSTLRHDQIDLARTNSTGAKHLRAFLQYAAERGAAQARGMPSALAFESEFERQVHDALTLAGHAVDTQVGCGGYRIDLALRHPREPGFYALGIECDGAPYHSAATARDRDRLRQQVLEGLHWQLHRVWSSDWWFDREGETKKLLAAVEAAIAREPAVRAPPIAPLEPARENVAQRLEPSSEVRIDTGGASFVSGPETEPYRVAELEVVAAASALHAPAQRGELQARIRAVVDVQGPVHVDALTRTVARSYSVDRVTERVRSTIGANLDQLAREGAVIVRDAFLWSGASKPADWNRIRVPEPGGEPRDVEEIAIEELAAAARWHLSQALSAPARELARSTLRTYGLTTLTKRAEERVQLALALLVDSGCARRIDERLEWIGDRVRV